MKNKGKILAIDFGKSKVGLAISDEDRKFAFRRGIIKDFKSLERLFEQIKRLCESEKVNLVILGLPLAINGSSTIQSSRIRKIGESLSAFLDKVKVEFVDESFSSHQANELIKSMNGAVSQDDDDFAAYIILGKYLSDKEAF